MSISIIHFRVLKVELETYKIRVKVLQEENRSLRQASVIIVSTFGINYQQTNLIVLFIF